jgi:hypothetical protein
MDVVNLVQLMEIPTKVITLKMICKDKENIFGMTRENMKVFGLIIKWIGLKYLIGLMEEDSKVTILMVKNLEKVFFID